MNYLTNYYKHLSEQLQEKVNHLQQLLEYKKSKIAYIDVDDIDPYTGEDSPRIIGSEVTKKGNPMGKGAQKYKRVSYYPSYEDQADAEEIVSNWGNPKVENNPTYASMKGEGPAIQVNRGELFQDRTDNPGKGGSEPGMGKKFKKKNLAIALAKIKERETRDMNPNIHDGPDIDRVASAAEIANSQAQKQMGYSQEPDEEPDYDRDPPEAEDAQVFMRMFGQKKTPRSRGEGGGISPYNQ